VLGAKFFSGAAHLSSALEPKRRTHEGAGARRSGEAIKAAHAGFTWCYEMEMRRVGAAFNETAIVHLAVLASGIVQRFELSGYAPERTELEICMARYACAVAFPRQPLGEDIVVEQRITMAPRAAPSTPQ
jgi:hypothetical protein